jgi:hypothetical protein
MEKGLMSFRRQIVAVIVFAVLSAFPVVVMLWKGLNLKFVEPFVQQVIEAYDDTATMVLGALEPFIHRALQLVDIHLVLQPHWRHVFLFMWLYFLNDARIFKATGRVAAARFGRVWGALAALAASVSSGLIPVGGTSFADNFFFCAFPIIGYFMYAMGVAWANGHYHREQVARALKQAPESYWDFFFTRAFRAAKIASAGFLIVAAGLLLIPLAPGGDKVQTPGLIMLGVLVVALGGFWLQRGINQGWDNAAKPGAGGLGLEVWTIGNTQLGLVMLGAIASAIVTVVLFTNLLG